MVDLSILIPARNEMFLKRTVEDILFNMRGNTEIIVALDGYWADPPIEQNEKVNIIHFGKSIGQREATNQACRLSKAKYVLKADAHCAFDIGFDIKLLADMQDDWTMVPTMRNLHVFDWVCPNGHRRYQGPSGVCTICGEPTIMDIVWIAKTSPQSNSYCFDAEPHFQYFNEYNKRPEAKGDLTETMSLQGSCFLLTREKYWDLNISDENFGSWGSQGIEVACKTWLSGGKCIVNHKTWYAHMFRTQGGDFGFPYPISGKQVEHAKETARNLFFENKWEKQIKPVSWLVEKFWPVRGWTDEDLNKLKIKEGSKIEPTKTKLSNNPKAGIVYYTDNRLDSTIMNFCQKQLIESANNKYIVSVSLKPMNFGDNIVADLERGYLTMFKQILAGLEAIDADIVFFAEHDILYPPEYFEFVPSDQTKIYYNLNCWHLRFSDGHALYYTAKRLSQLCAYRDILIEHYRQRILNTEKALRENKDAHEFNRFIRLQGFEPGTHNRKERVDNLQSEIWVSKYPTVDIKHGHNLTSARWKQDQFRDQRNCQNWQEAEEIPFWGKPLELFNKSSIL